MSTYSLKNTENKYGKRKGQEGHCETAISVVSWGLRPQKSKLSSMFSYTPHAK